MRCEKVLKNRRWRRKEKKWPAPNPILGRFSANLSAKSVEFGGNRLDCKIQTPSNLPISGKSADF
jgi:hypothetical protein